MRRRERERLRRTQEAQEAQSRQSQPAPPVNLDRIPTFFLEPTDTVRLSLRRFARGDEATKPTKHYHDVYILVGEALAIWTEPQHGRERGSLAVRPETFDGDPRWPVSCSCGYVFTSADLRQVNQSLIYRRHDTGALLTLDEAPDGASWFADWMLSKGSNHWRGPDGHCLVVRVPHRHDWIVDGIASNCPIPKDTKHKCWIRSGDPRTAKVTVGKKGGGPTCKAGAGSISVPGWHGFLRDGVLVRC